MGIRIRCLAIITVALFAAACGGQAPEQIQSNQSALGGVGTYVLHFNTMSSKLAKKVAALGGTVDFTHSSGIAIVSGLTEADANTLGAGSVVPDANLAMDIPATSQVEGVGALPLGAPAAAYFYARQWNMRAIDADAAWARGRLGSSAVTVAILDTGIDYTYPDLIGRVDLSRSASFVPEDDVYAAFYFPTKHPVTDLHYHGTHVAATVVSNGYVTAGVTSKTTLIGVKVCSAVLGHCPFSAIVQGLLHAVDNNADVVNMSLGGAFSKAHNGSYVGFFNKLFNTVHDAGVTVVVSAGNDAADLQHNGNTYATYCDSPHTICVSATAPTAGSTNGPWTDVDAPTSYTNYGKSAITVAAPGGDSGGWVWAGCSTTSLVIPICRTGYYVLGMAGTSMAAPHVTGLAALVVEDKGRKPSQVRAAITKGADDLGKRGADPFYGKGRINVNQSVK